MTEEILKRVIQRQAIEIANLTIECETLKSALHETKGKVDKDNESQD